MLTSKTLRMLVLAYSDQQLVTGSAMLLVAFIRLSMGKISIYHFTLVVDMAWFASNTHLITLTVLSEYLKMNAAARKWRLVAIISMGFLLLIATILSSNESWVGGLNCPAVCLTQQFSLILPAFSPATIYSLITFLVGYMVHVTPLFRLSREGWTGFKSSIRKIYERSQPRNRICQTIHRVSGEAISLTCEVLSSTVMAMLFHTAWFVFRTFQIFSDRKAGQKLINGDGSENAWSFGQVLAVLLLVLNTTSVIEFFCG